MITTYFHVAQIYSQRVMQNGYMEMWLTSIFDTQDANAIRCMTTKGGSSRIAVKRGHTSIIQCRLDAVDEG
jgi:hypothetical protein